MIKQVVAALTLWLMFSGCSFFPGLLHMEAVEIISWTPNRGLISAEQVNEVTVTFSGSMNRILAEEAFSLNREHQPLQGNFSWRKTDTVLVFIPEVPLADGCRFTLEVARTAEDLYGNSLSEPFNFSFATAKELVPPVVVLHEPADGQEMSSARFPIRVVFSEPIDPSSFYTGFSLFPCVQGGYSWNAGGEEVEFSPIADYQAGQTYEVVLGREISDRSGNQLDEDIRFEFRVDDVQEPSVESVTNLRDGKILVPLQLGGALDPDLQIEKDDVFLFTFSRAPTEEQKLDMFSVEPFAPFEVAWGDDNRTGEFGFEEYLCWNQVYHIDLLGLTYIFVVNGQRSAPITVTELTYCADLNAPLDDDKYVPLQFAQNLDCSNAPAPAFDFHLEHSPDSQIDIGSFLQAFELAIVPACLSITMKDVELSPLAIDPDPLPGSGQSVVRLHCAILEDPAQTGTITFRLGTELRDSAGNHLAEEYVLLVDNN